MELDSCSTESTATDVRPLQTEILNAFEPGTLVSLWPCDGVLDAWTNDKAIIERQRAKKVTHLPPLIGALMSLFFADTNRQVVALLCTAAHSWSCGADVFIEARSEHTAKFNMDDAIPTISPGPYFVWIHNRCCHVHHQDMSQLILLDNDYTMGTLMENRTVAHGDFSMAEIATGVDLRIQGRQSRTRVKAAMGVLPRRNTELKRQAFTVLLGLAAGRSLDALLALCKWRRISTTWRFHRLIVEMFRLAAIVADHRFISHLAKHFSFDTMVAGWRSIAQLAVRADHLPTLLTILKKVPKEDLVYVGRDLKFTLGGYPNSKLAILKWWVARNEAEYQDQLDSALRELMAPHLTSRFMAYMVWHNNIGALRYVVDNCPKDVPPFETLARLWHGRTLFEDALYFGHEEMLKTLIELFPQDWATCLQSRRNEMGNCAEKHPELLRYLI